MPLVGVRCGARTMVAYTVVGSIFYLTQGVACVSAHVSLGGPFGLGAVD